MMLKFLAHDTVNDIALIQTQFCYNVRYGLQNESCETLAGALQLFTSCQEHALAADFDAELENRG